MKTKQIVTAGFALALGIALSTLLFLPSGTAAPEVAFKSIDGRAVSLAELRGKPVIVTFWATTCPGCMQEMPHLIELYRELRPKGLEIVGVAMSYDPPSQVLELVKRKQVPYTIALDSDEAASRAFGVVRVTPTSFVISPEGRIVQQKIGEFDMPALREQLQKMLGA
ncbi:peroxiredoxin [Plasticicumulans lactativorans]|uniref:Peroxiredoxin n=1 Tax=Plasticicumulans lactativorans TaxID=1133106 RepID=A0A4V2SBI4_9GAMM|nr:TlpA disulfide reductase family protein [Plasticicumulans lactativorans]TCO75580.1 peroxiredoxin [Plasticicumulans lactativorans]